MWSKLLLLCLLSVPAQADALRDYIVRWEGYRQTVYACPAGTPTIGIGHNLSFEHQKVVYTDKEIEVYYTQDITRAKVIARKWLRNFDTLPQNVQFVTLSLIFTVGETGFVKFAKYRQSIMFSDYRQAARELRNSLWWKQVSPLRAQEHYMSLYFSPNPKGPQF